MAAIDNQDPNSGGGGGGGGGGWMVQTPSGQWVDISQAGAYPNGNIQGPDGTVYSHDGGMQAYQSSQQPRQAVNNPQTRPAPPGLHQIATSPDGVPYYQASDGSYYTQNPDGTYTQQTIDPSTWNQPPGAPPPTTPGPSSGAPSGGGGLINPWGGPGSDGTAVFQPPAMGALPNAPAYTPPPAFAKPTLEEAQNDPGFAFVQKMGQEGLEASAAARGVINSGGTLKDIAQWNQSLADTQYNNVWNRDLQQYLSNYQTQYADPFKNAMDVWGTQLQSAQRANEFNYLGAFDQYKFAYSQWLDRINESLRVAGGNG